MASEKVNVSTIGHREIIAKLDALPTKIRSKIVKSAVSRSTTVMKKELVKRVPVGSDPNPQDDKGNPRKRLKKSITKRTRTARRKDGVHGIVGVPKEFPRFVYMLHHGIKPHRVNAFRKPMRIGPFGFARTVQHPGVKAMPFMTESLNASKGKAAAILKQQLRTRLQSVAR